MDVILHRLRHLWAALHASLWFLPLLMGLASISVAMALLRAGPVGMEGMAGRLLFSGGSASARDLLGALLSGMISMSALVVSITMVVLALAAGQLGSRLIRSFIDDRVTQAVLGLFLATILYLLVVLRAIEQEMEDRLPQVAIGVGTLLAATCLFVLLFYVHKLARSIVFDNVAARVADELAGALERFDDEATQERDESTQALAEGHRPVDPDAPRPSRARPVALDDSTSGYVQSVAYATLAEAARHAKVRLWLDVRPGHWVNPGQPVAWVLPDAPEAGGGGRHDPQAAMRTAFGRAIIVGTERTPTQDPEFGLQRLVEISLRALSPGINDAFTAVAAIDNLSASLARILSWPDPPRVLRDEAGDARVVRVVAGACGLIDAAFDQIRQSGARMPAISIRLLEALARLAPCIGGDPARRDALLAQADAVLASAKPDDMADKDARAVRARHSHARRCLQGDAAVP